MLNHPNQLSVPKNSGNVKKYALNVFKICTYEHFFVKTLVQISTSTEVNHLTSKELYQKQKEILVALTKIDFRCGDDTSSIWPIINFRTFKKKQDHFNVLKCNFCFIINIWQKFKSYSRQFQSSNLHNVAEGGCTVFPWPQNKLWL